MNKFILLTQISYSSTGMDRVRNLHINVAHIRAFWDNRIIFSDTETEVAETAEQIFRLIAEA